MVTVCLHVADGFPILSLTLVTEPLRIANRELGQNRFDWLMVSDDGQVRRSSSGIPMDTTTLPDQKQDVVILLASYRPGRSATGPTLSWLRRQDRLGALMACVDTGALVFAKAGLLRVRPAAAHPEAIGGFHREFPDSLFIDRLFDVSPPRASSAGGVATLDMTLGLIGHFAGDAVSGRVAEVLTYQPMFPGQVMSAVGGSVSPVVREAVRIMMANPSRCPSPSEIASRVGVPPWRLTRLFKRSLRMSPRSYSVELRLQRARDMLRNTTLAVSEIAADCGYDNAEVFSRAYRKRFGLPPSHDRAPGLADASASV